MMTFLRRYKVHVLSGLLAFFVIYIALGFGSSFFVKGSPNDTVVEVNGEDVPVRKYWTYYNRSLDPNRPLDEAARKQKQDETIRDLVQSVIFTKEIDRYGIAVPDRQVATSLTQIPAFQSDGRFDPSRYVQMIRSQLRTTPQEFEEEQRMSIGFYKLRWMIQSAIRVTDLELQQAEGFADFAKANQFEETEIKDPKTGKVTDHKKRKRSEAEIRELFRSKLWNDKVMFSFNQWLNQLGQNIRVKPHLDVLEGRAQG